MLQHERAPVDGPTFLRAVLPHVPTSEVRAGIERALTLPDTASAQDAAIALGNGSQVSGQDTVPFTLWCASRSLHDYEEALWLTASGFGDVDTTCAIVGGIVAAGVGASAIPPAWLAAREPLPPWPFQTGESHRSE
jgi:hypothetical protein